jgi:formate hydrogenlyase subunit 6/NADH:ubiquinone oxidoreductase subunit I
MAFFEMSKLALKWVLKKPPTSQYPFEPRRVLAGSRGKLVFTKETCVYCNVCAKKCPTAALVVQRAQKKWSIDRLRCISCGYCVEACPKDSLALDTAHDAPTVTRDRESH